jgi:hypothetical protein
MKEPVDHIIRPRLPWRSGGDITECGYDATKVKALTREEYVQRFQELGQQRCAMFTCMTCADTTRRWGTWDDDPRTALAREITWEGAGRRWREDRGQRLKDELLAIAALIDAHQDEFAARVSEIGRRREWLEKKAAMGNKPQRPRPRLL